MYNDLLPCRECTSTVSHISSSRQWPKAQCPAKNYIEVQILAHAQCLSWRFAQSPLLTTYPSARPEVSVHVQAAMNYGCRSLPRLREQQSRSSCTRARWAGGTIPGRERWRGVARVDIGAVARQTFPIGQCGLAKSWVGSGVRLERAGIEPSDAIASCQWARLTFLDPEAGGGAGCMAVGLATHRAGGIFHSYFVHRKQSSIQWLASTLG